MLSVDVLHIDRNRDARAKLASSVGSHPTFRVRGVCSSEEALSITKNWSPDLILLDSSLHREVGPDTLAQLRRQKKSSDVPVIILSAENTPRLDDQTFEGIAGEIRAPFDPAQLWSQVNALLLKRLQRVQSANHDLEQQLARITAVNDTADSGIVILDGDGTILRFNQAAERMSGFRASDVIGRNYLEIIPRDQIAHDADVLARVRAGETVRFETRRLQRDGSQVDVSLKIYPIRNRAGHIVGAVSVARNIGDRKAAEAALAVSEARHAQVIQGMSVGVWDWDIAAGTSFWSDRLKDMLGLPRDFVPSRGDFVSRLHPDDRDHAINALRRHISHREPYDVEYRLQKHDGSYLWLRATAQAAWDLDDKPIRVVGSVDDISTRKAAEARLRELNESLEAQVAAKSAKLRTVVDAIPSMIAYWDKELRCGFANAAYLEWFGRRSAQMPGIPIQTLLGDELFTKNEPHIRAALSGTAQHFQRQLTKADGSIGQTWASYIPHRGPGGELAGFFVIVTDVTAMVEAEARVQQSEARYRLLAQHISDVVIQLDCDLVRRYVSPACSDILGYAESDLLGTQPFGMIHPDDVDRFRAACASLLNGEQAHAMTTVRKRHRDGRWRWIETMMRAYRNSQSGEIEGIVKTLRDITARKEIEELLTQRTQQLELANCELDNFAYAASHDLKAPLRTIRNAALWIEEDLEPHLTEESRSHLTLLRSRTQRLDKLLDDLLLFSRAGHDGGGTEMISGTELIDNVLALLSRPPGFAVISKGFEALAVARMPAQQILMNLISNAIKHHDKATGQIEVTADDLGAQLAFTVKDDGPGIAARYHERIFKMFQTLKSQDEVEGSGMGLAIVRKQIEHAGGTLTLQSSEGQGSTFRFTLPAVRPAGLDLAAVRRADARREN
jgi:PAS domain S-box-containing protein